MVKIYTVNSRLADNSLLSRDTQLLRTGAEVLENKKLLQTTHAITDSLYYGHQILAPMVLTITRGYAPINVNPVGGGGGGGSRQGVGI